MGRTILCPHCGSSMNEDILKKRNSENVCLVCGESLITSEDNTAVSPEEKTTYYYYEGAGGTLTSTLYDDETPLYIFEAIDMEDAERQLKEVMPNSPLLNGDSSDSGKVRCPRCRSTKVQLLPKKFSFLTGFATNQYVRVCVGCKKKF